MDESEFQAAVRDWFEREYGPENVQEEVYQPGPYWFVDLVVEAPPAVYYIEIEDSGSDLRKGIGQAVGYASDHDYGVPTVVVPKGEAESQEAQALQESQAVVLRAFDHENDIWV